MREFTFREIEKAVGGKQIWGSPDTVVLGVSKDSREAYEGSLFFPLKGEKYDAHSFLPQVIQRGCRTFLISDEEILKALKGKENLDIIKVKDTTVALQDLAGYYLKQMSPKKIAVTGSVGKTSTKDMIHCVCCSKYKTGKTKGNQNNHIGLPLGILSFDEDTEAAVLEMGMDRPGEIDFLADLVRPDIGVITNIGISHKENLGSREGIFRAKMELVNYFGRENVLIINSGKDFLLKKNIEGEYRLISAGAETDNDFIVSDIRDKGEKGTEFFIKYRDKKQLFKLSAPGRHNAFNAALAAACGMEMGIDLKESSEALLSLEITTGRLTVKAGNGIKVIDDTYNASPDSMKAGIDTLVAVSSKRKIAILGDMFELGDDADIHHRKIGEYAKNAGADMVIAVGEMAENIARGAAEKGHYYKSKEALKKDIDEIVKSGDAVLVKASRGMEMEEIVKILVDKQEKK